MIAPVPTRAKVIQLLLLVPLFTLLGLRWTVRAGRAREPAARLLLAADRLLVAGRGRRRACCSARPDGSRSPRAVRGCCCAACEPGRYAARWQRPSAAVDRRAAGRVQRGDLADRLVAGAVRAGAGRQDRPGRRPALAAAGHRHAASWAGALPWSPRWTCPAGGWTATGWRSARSGSARTPSSAPAACSSRAPGSASGPRWRRVRRSPVRSRPVSAGPARPRSSSARPSATGPRSVRSAARTGV